MFPFEEEGIIPVIDRAYRCGLNMPKYFFKNEYDSIKDTLNDCEAYYSDPMIIIKPEGVEFTYIMYYNGKHLKGGFISINNNYMGIQRGARIRNGSLMFAAHVPDIKIHYKKFDQTGWMAKCFVMDHKGKCFYWGDDDASFFTEQIEKLTGEKFDKLSEYYQEGGRTERPKGFVASLPVFSYDKEGFVCTGDREDSISKAWHVLENKLDMLKKEYWFTCGLDSYMRGGFSSMMKTGKLA